MFGPIAGPTIASQPQRRFRRSEENLMDQPVTHAIRRGRCPRRPLRGARWWCAFVSAAMLAAVIAAPAAASGHAEAVAELPSADQAGEPQPPPKHDPKPKKHPKPGTPSDEEPPPPGPGERITSPAKLTLFEAAGFRYQDTNWYACTSTSAM